LFATYASIALHVSHLTLTPFNSSMIYAACTVLDLFALLHASTDVLVAESGSGFVVVEIKIA
jgi:hypothetical protein